MKVFRPKMADAPLLAKTHKQVYGKTPNQGYYEEILYQSHNPFYVAADDENQLLGFIAARVKPDTSEVYIASYITLHSDDDDPTLFDEIEQKLISAVEKDAKRLKAKKISMHSRKKKVNVSRAFDMAGYTIKDSGTYKDGGKKVHIYKNLKGGKNKLVIPTYKPKKKDYTKSYAKTTYKPKPKPKKGVYEIKPATVSNVWQVVNLHNANMVKQREGTYFTKLINKFRRPVFFVALDSNKDVIGYVAARPERPPTVTSGKHTRLNFVSMAVNPKWRGLGIAQDLIMAMQDEAKSRPEMEYIYGHVRGQNKGARRLYEKMGFKLKTIGQYKDDGDDKYLLKKRYRLPSIKPYWNQYKDYIMWFGVGVGTHEVIHLVRNYED